MKEVNKTLKAISTQGNKTTKLDILNFIRANPDESYLEKIILNLKINRTVALDAIKGLLSTKLIQKKNTNTQKPIIYELSPKGKRVLFDVLGWG